MAIVTPILALLIAAMFDFGFLFRNWEVVTNAAREGARVGVLPVYACDGSTTDVEQRVSTPTWRRRASANRLVRGRRWTTTRSRPRPAPSTPAVVTVEITQPLPSLERLRRDASAARFGNVPLRAAAVMRTEAQAAP